jgi:hypothetical protein
MKVDLSMHISMRNIEAETDVTPYNINRRYGAQANSQKGAQKLQAKTTIRSDSRPLQTYEKTNNMDHADWGNIQLLSFLISLH